MKIEPDLLDLLYYFCPLVRKRGFLLGEEPIWGREKANIRIL